MCNGYYPNTYQASAKKRTPEERMSDYIYDKTGAYIGPGAVVTLMRDHWDYIAPLAHRIHDNACADKPVKVELGDDDTIQGRPAPQTVIIPAKVTSTTPDVQHPRTIAVERGGEVQLYTLNGRTPEVEMIRPDMSIPLVKAK